LHEEAADGQHGEYAGAEDDGGGDEPHGESDHGIKDGTCRGGASATLTLNVGGP
jgi:hypothetical protein